MSPFSLRRAKSPPSSWLLAEGEANKPRGHDDDEGERRGVPSRMDLEDDDDVVGRFSPDPRTPRHTHDDGTLAKKERERERRRRCDDVTHWPALDGGV